MKKIVNMMILSFGVIFMLQGTSYADPCASAKREMTYGRVALQDAKNKQDYLDSAKQFEAAIGQAPSCAAAHFNLGVVYEKAGEYQKALKALKKYLSLAPRASDADNVQEKIYELEYRAKKASVSSDWSVFSGTWCPNGVCDESANAMAARAWQNWPERSTYQVSVNSNSFNARNEWVFISEREGSLETHKETFNGKIHPDGTIDGEYTEGTINTPRQTCPNIYLKETLPFSGRLIRNKESVSEDRIELKWRSWSRNDIDRRHCKQVRLSGGRWIDMSRILIRMK